MFSFFFFGLISIAAALDENASPPWGGGWLALEMASPDAPGSKELAALLLQLPSGERRRIKKVS